MTDEEWRKLEWEDEYFSTLEKEYKPPRFDPFVELNPPVSIIKEVIKKLKQQAYAEQQNIQRQKNSGVSDDAVAYFGKLIQSLTRQRNKFYTYQSPEARLSQTISKIKSYQYRLTSRERTGSWQYVEHLGTIGEDQVRRAKEVPIESLYDGRLRRSGSNLVGLCPFHTERGSSFYIYKKDNRWTCFGACGISGDSIDYIIARDGVDFITAVKYLNNV